jgi:hypothetical protein
MIVLIGTRQGDAMVELALVFRHEIRPAKDGLQKGSLLVCDNIQHIYPFLYLAMEIFKLW